MPANLQFPHKVPSSAGGVQVFFGSVAAPVLYASSTQVNTIAPDEVVGSAPGIFTVNSAGIGPAAVLNQDNSFNTPANAAARGSTIQIYATGEGITPPPGVTGELTGADLKHSVLVSAGGSPSQKNVSIAVK